MKITDLHIDQFGVWRHLALPVESSGLTVFYGPNEAGKTTLLRFIRGVLYGFPAGHRDTSSTGWYDSNADAGTLRVDHNGQQFEIARERDGNHGERLDVIQVRESGRWDRWDDAAFNGGAEVVEERLAELLSHTDSDLFRTVFAIGLQELQELSTLQDDEVSKHLYGSSLGPAGRRLADVFAEIDRRRQGFADGVSQGEIASWLERDEQIREELRTLGDQREQHANSSARLKEIDAEIAKLEERRRLAQQQLKGYATVENVVGPWRRVQELELKLAGLPTHNAEPSIDWDRIERWDAELKDLQRRRDEATAQADEQQSSPDAQTEKYLQCETAIRGLAGQRQWITEAVATAQRTESHAEKLRADWDAARKRLGVTETVSHESHAAVQFRLESAGREFTESETNRDQLQKRYQTQHDALHQRQNQLTEAIALLPEKNLDAAREFHRTQRSKSQELTRMQRRAPELQQDVERLRSSAIAAVSRPELPAWAGGFLLFLALSGLILSVVGFFTGLISNGIAGAILAFIGLSGFSIARAFVMHADSYPTEEQNTWERQLRTKEAELAQLQHDISGRSQEVAAWAKAVPPALSGSSEPDESRVYAFAGERLDDLKHLRAEERRLEKRRKHVSRLKNHMQQAKRDADTARQNWCRLLRDVGIPETADVTEAVAAWRERAGLAQQHEAWQKADREAQDAARRMEDLQRQLNSLAAQLGESSTADREPSATLTRWETALDAAKEAQREHREAQQEVKNLRREATRLKHQIEDIRQQRSSLLSRAGASSREEDESRRGPSKDRRELETQLAAARAELEAASRQSSELAIVESDLRNFDAPQSRASREKLSVEISESDAALGLLHEERGRLEQQVKELESCRRAQELRNERNGIQQRLKNSLADWAGAETAADVLQRLQGGMERDGQPETLTAASDYLSQLTDRRYRRVWASLNEQRLRVEDAHGKSFTVEQLSNGTREQLFLAIRMALVSAFRRRGIELPLVLDDIVANFDQTRTEAAVETLQEFAEQGHQVMFFTCHMHIAQLCETRGVEPIWLPSHEAVAEHRRAG